MPARHWERHRLERVGWLRAAVLGANDGIVSTASLLLGVAAADASHSALLVAGIAGARCGRDVDGGRRVRLRELASRHASKRTSRVSARSSRPTTRPSTASSWRSTLAAGSNQALARNRWPTQLMAHDALGAHARDELGITDLTTARPLQAAVASAASFACGRVAAAARRRARAAHECRSLLVPSTALVFLALLGAIAARAGGAKIAVGAARVTFWGALAMAVDGRHRRSSSAPIVCR